MRPASGEASGDRLALKPDLEAVLPDAERVLDELALEARREADAFAMSPEVLHQLVDEIRPLSGAQPHTTDN